MQAGQVVHLDAKFALFSERWQPKVVARANGQELKLIKVQGVFPWHVHDREDELFLVWRGRFRVEFRDHVATLDPGDLIVVPAGLEHRTAADVEAEVLCFEPVGVVNTGNVLGSGFTAPTGAEI